MLVDPYDGAGAFGLLEPKSRFIIKRQRESNNQNTKMRIKFQLIKFLTFFYFLKKTCSAVLACLPPAVVRQNIPSLHVEPAGPMEILQALSAPHF